MKLVQGIDETENQMQKDKEMQKAQRPEEQKEAGKDTPKDIQKPQTVLKHSRIKKNTLIDKKRENKPNQMQKKQVFSFRAMVSDIAGWKAYATATGQTVENLGNAAMKEYLKKHKLDKGEQMVFEVLKHKEESKRE